MSEPGALIVGSPLCLLHSPTRIVGIRPGPVGGTLLVTVQSQGVTLFDVATQSATRTWHTRSAQLTHAACFEPLAATAIRQILVRSLQAVWTDLMLDRGYPVRSLLLPIFSPLVRL